MECRDPSFSCQNLKSVMDASSHGPMTAGPVERPPAPPAASHSRRRTRSMSAHESLTGERDGSALVAPTLTDHQGDVACDDPHSKSPEPIPRCARVPDPRAHLDDTDAQPADPLPSDGACQVRVISTTSTVKTSPAEAAAPSSASQETERARTTRPGGKALTGGEADRPNCEDVLHRSDVDRAVIRDPSIPAPARLAHQEAVSTPPSPKVYTRAMAGAGEGCEQAVRDVCGAGGARAASEAATGDMPRMYGDVVSDVEPEAAMAKSQLTSASGEDQHDAAKAGDLLYPLDPKTSHAFEMPGRDDRESARDRDPALTHTQSRLTPRPHATLAEDYRAAQDEKQTLHDERERMATGEWRPGRDEWNSTTEERNTLNHS